MGAMSPDTARRCCNPRFGYAPVREGAWTKIPVQEASIDLALDSVQSVTLR